MNIETKKVSEKAEVTDQEDIISKLRAAIDEQQIEAVLRSEHRDRLIDILSRL